MQLTGIVTWFHEIKGFGFIQNDAGGDVFVHFSDIRREGFRTLTKGERVRFTLKPSEGGPKAGAVTVLPAETSPSV